MWLTSKPLPSVKTTTSLSAVATLLASVAFTLAGSKTEMSMDWNMRLWPSTSGVEGECESFSCHARLAPLTVMLPSQSSTGTPICRTTCCACCTTSTCSSLKSE